ncbi:MAG: cell division ATP-binding protein FtsE [Deltaproteobacteria bacterium]|nr:cell division ATP-binding protein FtsE [Deltaproteobacteria bacterium]
MIELNQVSKSYTTHPQALSDITFAVERGKFVFLIGPSGSGKTTLLKLLYAAERPTHGEIRVNGFNLARLKGREIPRLRRSLGIVFQDFKLFPNRTLFENVAFALEVLGADKREIFKKTAQALQWVGLERKGNCFPDQVAAGEQQRVAIARAVVNEPQLVLADEPTGNMDPRTAEDMLRYFEEINSRGATVIWATHNERLLDLFPRERIVLEQGRIVENSMGKADVAGSLVPE